MGLLKDIFYPDNPGPFHFVRLRILATIAVVTVFGSYYLITEFLKDRASKERYRISEVERVKHIKQLIQKPISADYFYLKLDKTTRFLNPIKDEGDSILCKISAKDAEINLINQIKNVVEYFDNEKNAPQKKFSKSDLLNALCFDESEATFSNCQIIKGLNNNKPLHINKASRYYGIDMHTRRHSFSRDKNRFSLAVVNDGLDVEVIGFNYKDGNIKLQEGDWPIVIKKKDYLKFYVEPSEKIDRDKELKFEFIVNTKLNDSIRLVFNKQPKQNNYQIANY